MLDIPPLKHYTVISSFEEAKMKHLISIADLSADEVWHILSLARELKER